MIVSSGNKYDHALRKAMKIPLFGNFVVAGMVANIAYQMETLKHQYVSGPICGSHPIENGIVDFNKTY